ncbi:PefC/AfrB family outer membrane usher protein [Escherichia coli]|nr:outer membrane usher protein PefC [Escherichia coli]MBC0836274.1 PefC/AfrB family outer membrane usher protein [Escherichia coli]
MGIYLRLFKMSALSVAIFNSVCSIADTELNLDFLQGTKTTPSVLISGSRYPAGEYYLDVLVNDEYIGKTTLIISKDEEKNNTLCLSEKWLKDAGVRLRLSDYKSAFDELRQCYLFSNTGYTKVDFDYGAQRLKFNIPQSYLISKTDPSQWDYGVNAVRLKYSGNFSDSTDSKTSAYGNVDVMFNAGKWILASNMNATRDSNGHSQFAARDITLSRAVSKIQGDLILGKSQTRSELFSDFGFYGASLRSNSNMKDWDLRGYSPVISGVATSASRITVRQNGYTIYSKVVPSGPYNLDDVQPVGNGDLVVEVEDASGRKTYMYYPVTTLPSLLRPGEFQYDLAVGKKNNSSELKDAFSSDSGTFWLGSLGYGFSSTTVNAASIIHTKYQAGGISLTQMMGGLGAVSVGANISHADYKNGTDKHGYSYSAKYAKSFTNSTDLQLLAYRFESKGYVEFSDFNTDDEYINYNKKSRYEAQLAQRLGNSSLSLQAWQEDYWNFEGHARGASLSFSSVIFDDVSLYLSGNYSKRPYMDKPDYSTSLGISVPFTLGGVRHYSSSSVGYSQTGRSTFNTSISASPTERLNYNLNAQMSEKGERGISAGMGYAFNAVQTNVGLEQSQHRTTVSGSLSGQILGTPESGFLMTKESGNTLGIVNVPGVSGVSFNNSLPTNSKGNTVVGLSGYSLNHINIDMDNVPDDLELQATSYNVVPTEGAVVYRQFGADYVQRYILQIRDHNGHLLDGGTAKTAQGLNVGNVAGNGVLMMSLLSEPDTVLVDMGRGNQCRFSMSGITPSATRVQEVYCE